MSKLLDQLKANPWLYIQQLFIDVEYKKIGGRVYFDSPSFDSFDYNLSSNKCKDFRSNQSYNLISLYAHFFANGDYQQAKEQILQKLGSDVVFKPTFKHDQSRKPDDDKIREFKQQLALKIWQKASKANGTLVEQYLSVRGIQL